MSTLRPSGIVFGFAVMAAFGLTRHAAVAAAQSGPGWNAWYGCWQPIDPELPGAVPMADEEAICILPSSRGEAEFIAFEDGAIGSRELVGRMNARETLERDGCSGWQMMQWSDDGRRLFNQSELACGAGLERSTAGIFSMLPSGRWVSAESVDVDGVITTRAIHYRPIAPLAELTGAEAAALRDRQFATETARVAASAGADLEDVVEAVNTVGAPAVEAWLIEQDQEFAVDASALRQLADAGVPDSVIDLMVALSYPNVFAIDRTAREGEQMGGGNGGWTRPPRRGPWYYPMYRGWGYYPGYGYGGWYGRPVVIVPSRDPERPSSGGKLINGRGYTRPGSGSSSSASPSSGGRSSSSPSAGSGGGSTTRSGGSSNDTPRRTAKPRSD